MLDHIRQRQNEINKSITSSIGGNFLTQEDLEKSVNDYFEKGGKKAVIGETRTFGGREYIKTSSGWKFHGKGTGAKAQEHRAGALGHHVEAGKEALKPKEEEEDHSKLSDDELGKKDSGKLKHTELQKDKFYYMHDGDEKKRMVQYSGKNYKGQHVLGGTGYNSSHLKDNVHFTEVEEAGKEEKLTNIDKNEATKASDFKSGDKVSWTDTNGQSRKGTISIDNGRVNLVDDKGNKISGGNIENHIKNDNLKKLADKDDSIINVSGEEEKLPDHKKAESKEDSVAERKALQEKHDKATHPVVKESLKKQINAIDNAGKGKEPEVKLRGEDGMVFNGKKISSNWDSGTLTIDGTKLQGRSYGSVFYKLHELIQNKTPWSEIEKQMQKTTGSNTSDRPGVIWGQIKRHLKI